MSQGPEAGQKKGLASLQAIDLFGSPGRAAAPVTVQPDAADYGLAAASGVLSI